jgi:hypothetical protein
MKLRAVQCSLMDEVHEEPRVVDLEPTLEPDVDSAADGTASTRLAGDGAWPFGLDSLPPSRANKVSSFVRSTPL